MKPSIYTFIFPIRFFGIWVVVLALLCSVYIPTEAMLKRDPVTGQLHMVFCPVRGTEYHAVAQSLSTKKTHKSMPMSDHLSGMMPGMKEDGQGHHHEQGGKTPPSCSPSLTAPLAADPGSLDLSLTSRVPIPFLYEIYGLHVFVGQSPIRQSARGPPRIL